jgi:hypothetical protein
MFFVGMNTLLGGGVGVEAGIGNGVGTGARAWLGKAYGMVTGVGVGMEVGVGLVAAGVGDEVKFAVGAGVVTATMAGMGPGCKVGEATANGTVSPKRFTMSILTTSFSAHCLTSLREPPCVVYIVTLPSAFLVLK